MLEDLDILADRILQVVQLARSLQAEKHELLKRMATLEKQYQDLQAQQQLDRDEFNHMSAKVAAHQQELQQARADAARLGDDLKDRYEQQKNRSESLQNLLNDTTSERDRLRTAASEAQQQIELILERLPGAEV